MSTERTSRIALIAAGLLLSANVAVPLVWGDLYPFTSAPMFRDCPTCCCNYQVYAPDGRELPAEDWLVQRVYDGNPVGYGVGICPPAILEQSMGVEHGEAEVRQHIERQFAREPNRDYPYVDVVQETIGNLDHHRVGVVRTSRWRVARPQ